MVLVTRRPHLSLACWRCRQISSCTRSAKPTSSACCRSVRFRHPNHVLNTGLTPLLPPRRAVLAHSLAQLLLTAWTVQPSPGPVTSLLPLQYALMNSIHMYSTLQAPISEHLAAGRLDRWLEAPDYTSPLGMVEHITGVDRLHATSAALVEALCAMLADGAPLFCRKQGHQPLILGGAVQPSKLVGRRHDTICQDDPVTAPLGDSSVDDGISM